MIRFHRTVSVLLTAALCAAPVVQPIAIYAQAQSAAATEQAALEEAISESAAATQASAQAAEGADETSSDQSAESTGQSAAGDAGQQGQTSTAADGTANAGTAAADPTAEDAVATEDAAVTDDTASDEGVLTGRKPNSWRYIDGVPRDLGENGISLLEMTTLPEGATAQGIDVSGFQSTIDWDQVKAAGIDYAIIRIGYIDGGQMQYDSQFKRNVQECERLGIPWGAYLYSYATNVEDAKLEANLTIEALKGLTPDLPIYLDVEEDSEWVDPKTTDFATVCTTYCNMISDAGYTPGVYANLKWWNNYLTDSCFNQWHRWVAQYYTVCQYQGEYSMWQYTSSGSVPGIQGNVDINYWYGEPLSEPEDTYTGWIDANGDPTDAAHAVGWVDADFRAKTKFFYDPSTDGWYWAEADGSIAKNHDAYVPLNNTVAGDAWENASTAWRVANGKWVRLGADGKMVKGESLMNGNWYLFDEVTGAMQYGFMNLGSKWVFYDYITGIMAHGERYIDNSHGDEAGWMYFDEYTGAVQYGWKEISDGNNGTKWVYYNTVTGRMVYGRVTIDGYSRYFDTVTGACDKIGYQNPVGYFQVSSRSVTLPSAAYATRFSYVTPSRISVDANRDQCVNAMLNRAYEYLGTPYVWDYALAPGVGVDCSGLVMQCLYATGMNLDSYNPYAHWFDPFHSHDANNMAADSRFMHVSFSDRQRGDLIFYPGHVAIYLGNNQIIDAYSPSTGVRIAGIYDGGSTITAVGRPFV